MTEDQRAKVEARFRRIDRRIRAYLEGKHPWVEIRHVSPTSISAQIVREPLDGDGPPTYEAYRWP